MLVHACVVSPLWPVHKVDLSTGFKTRTILCMPVRDESGMVVGVVQVINKQDEEDGATKPGGDNKRNEGAGGKEGRYRVFDRDDEAALGTLCTHVAVVISQKYLQNSFRKTLAEWEEKATSIDDRFSALRVMHDAKCQEHDTVHSQLVIAQQERFQLAEKVASLDSHAKEEQHALEASAAEAGRRHAEEVQHLSAAAEAEVTQMRRELQRVVQDAASHRETNAKLRRRVEVAEAARKKIREETQHMVGELRQREVGDIAGPPPNHLPNHLPKRALCTPVCVQ